jgi:hypothetical protein
MAQTKIIGGGVVTPGVELGIDPTFNALRASLRPLDYAMAGQILGHYRVAATTAAIAPAANAVLANFRWGDLSRYAVIQRASIAISVVTAVTAQRTDPITLTVQRGYTANETTNITTVTPTQNTGKARVNMGSSLVSQIGVASLAAGISGGVRTADVQAESALAVVGSGAGLTVIGSGQPMDDLIRYDQITMHPLTLSANEGFLVQWGPTALATGTVEITVVLAWSEVVTF